MSATGTTREGPAPRSPDDDWDQTRIHLPPYTGDEPVDHVEACELLSMKQYCGLGCATLMRKPVDRRGSAFLSWIITLWMKSSLTRDGCLHVVTYMSLRSPPPQPKGLDLWCIGCPFLSSKFRDLDRRIGAAPFGGFTPLTCLKLSNADFLRLNYSASIVSLSALSHGLPHTSCIFDVAWNRTVVL